MVDFALYPFVASWYWPKTPIRTIRGYTEGIAESHFVPDGVGTYGRRLTGNPSLAGAPTIMILGDSHVVQDSVRDDQTVGSAIERIARAAGRPVNAAQYGWYETAAPTFIGEAAELLQRVQPARVIAMLNYTDLSAEVYTGQYWRFSRDGAFRLIDVRPPKVEDSGKATLRDLAGVSRLLVAGRRRAFRVWEAARAVPKSEATSPAVDLSPITAASVQGLKQAYGDKLLIVFTPVCDARCTEEPEPSEKNLLEACRAQSVECVSVRHEMVEALKNSYHLARGYHNTAPGRGHLNDVGLDLTGRVIWREIAKGLP